MVPVGAGGGRGFGMFRQGVTVQVEMGLGQSACWSLTRPF